MFVYWEKWLKVWAFFFCLCIYAFIASYKIYVLYHFYTVHGLYSLIVRVSILSFLFLLQIKKKRRSAHWSAHSFFSHSLSLSHIHTLWRLFFFSRVRASSTSCVTRYFTHTVIKNACNCYTAWCTFMAYMHGHALNENVSANYVMCELSVEKPISAYYKKYLSLHL